jgi:hypothetical protein
MFVFVRKTNLRDFYKKNRIAQYYKFIQTVLSLSCCFTVCLVKVISNQFDKIFSEREIDLMSHFFTFFRKKGHH